MSAYCESKKGNSKAGLAGWNPVSTVKKTDTGAFVICRLKAIFSDNVAESGVRHRTGGRYHSRNAHFLAGWIPPLLQTEDGEVYIHKMYSPI